MMNEQLELPYPIGKNVGDIKKLIDIVKASFDYVDGELIYRHDTTHNKAGNKAGSPTNYGYKEVYCNGNNHLVHRLIYLWHHGWLPPLVDHANRDKSDNRIENLRPLSKSQNNHNSEVVKSATGFRGVHYVDRVKMFRAGIYINGKRHDLGYYKTAEEAGFAYIEAKESLVDYVFNPNERSLEL